ncbi:MAG TPA: hypothetical protein VK817_20190 [Trebonia sp.]|jgi:hypothetical protein|nr:hypothetical protein [Trebonia sp.]
MGQKIVRFSDLSGQLIMQDDTLARIVVHEHPDLGDGPVEIEALADEALAFEKEALNVAVLDIFLPGEDEPRRVTLDADVFNEKVTERPAAELLVSARPAKRARTGSAPRTDRVDYGTLEHAGKPHRGKATDAEKTLVRENLDEINKRLAAEGLRTISRDDAEHVERYGLAALAQADAPTADTAKTGAAKAGTAKASTAKASAAADADA